MGEIKTFDVDWDSSDSIHRLRQKLKSREDILLNKGGEKSDLLKKKYDSIVNIWNSDIEFIYDDRAYDSEKEYYVYCHMNPLKPIIVSHRKNPTLTFAATLGMTHAPFYIGKGKSNRAYDLNRNGNHKKIKQFIGKLGQEPLVHLIKEGISERESFILEDKLIDIFGLDVYGGCLTNLDEGLAPRNRRFLYKEDFEIVSGSRGKALMFEKR